jgi:hypothetical protein
MIFEGFTKIRSQVDFLDKYDSRSFFSERENEGVSQVAMIRKVKVETRNESELSPGQMCGKNELNE